MKAGAKRVNPIGELDRMAEEFRSTSAFLRIGAGDDHAELIRELIMAHIDSNFDAIRARVLRDAEMQAAQAGKKN